MGKNYNRSCNGLTEHQEQCLVFDWKRLLIERYPDIRSLHAVPNGAKLPYTEKGGRRYSPEAIKLKKEGLTPGMLDINWPLAKRGYHGLWVEMKVGKNTLTDEQAEMKQLLEQQGNYCVVCYSYQDAIRVIEWYADFRSVDFGIEMMGSY